MAEMLRLHDEMDNCPRVSEGREMNQLAIKAAEEIERTLFMAESEYHHKIMKSESYFREDTAEIIDRVCCGSQKEAVQEVGPLTLDTSKDVFFYEQEFYGLSNFSAFRMYWKGLDFDTSEAVYHWEKFSHEPQVQDAIRLARSAHEAFKIAERHKVSQRPDWEDVRVEIMQEILLAKANQHEYVRRKLLETGDRHLIENSWRDSFWGWGEDRHGLNMLGQLWRRVRSELRVALARVTEGEKK